MKRFVSSEGVVIDDDPESGVWMENGPSRVYLGASAVRAFSERVIAEEDERLGRWRFPENPDYVVYAWTADPPRNDNRGVTVLSEAIPRGYTVWEDNVDTLYGTSENEEARVLARKAARAYFEAHPEPKPAWHDAKPGEVWALTVDGAESAFYPSKSLDRAFTPVTPETGRTAVGMESFEITAGRRIWPES